MNGWIIGYIVGGGLAVVVVVLLVLMIRGATLAAGKAEDISVALDEARVHTAGLWDLAVTNSAVTRIALSATALREHLQGSEVPR